MLLLKRLAGAIVALILLALIVIYGGSQWIISSSHAVPLKPIAVPHDAASVAEGARLATVFGCRSCHGKDGEGKVWPGPPWFIATVRPPAFAAKVPGYSDEELLRLIRHGIKKDGTSTFIMPAIAHRNIADDDMGKIIAWLRTLKPGANDVPNGGISVGPMGRIGLLSGQFTPAWQEADVAPKTRPAEIGRYYYDAMCSECHLLGDPKPSPDGGATAPALAPMAASYDPAAFKKLLRTGQGMSKRDLGLMKEMGQETTFALNDAEIAAVQAYLKSEAEKLPAK